MQAEQTSNKNKIQSKIQLPTDLQKNAKMKNKGQDAAQMQAAKKGQPAVVPNQKVADKNASGCDQKK